MSKARALPIALGGWLAATMPVASQSLFSQPTAEEPQPAAPEVSAPKPRPKPRGPTPARSLTISNASSNTLTALEISAEGKSAKLAKPLLPKERTTLKLPALKRCIVSVSAGFEGVGEAEANDYNVCREKSIRFTD